MYFLTFDAKFLKMSVINGPNMPTITGSNLNGTYSYSGFHWHWGYSDHQGSEHTFDGVSSPMEIHISFRAPSGLMTVGFNYEV